MDGHPGKRFPWTGSLLLRFSAAKSYDIVMYAFEMWLCLPQLPIGLADRPC